MGSLTHHIWTPLCTPGIQTPWSQLSLGARLRMLSPSPARRPAPPGSWGALTPLSPALCRRAAVLRAAPGLWLPHPHRQLHRQPGPAAEDALQQVGWHRVWVPGSRRARERPTRGSRPAGVQGAEAHDSFSPPSYLEQTKADLQALNCEK